MYYPKSINLATFGINFDLISGLISTFGYHEFEGLSPDFIDNLVQIAQGLLIEQFEESQIINNFVSVFVSPLQECEFVASELKKCRDLDTMTGHRLDIAGIIIGAPRNNLNDNEYRTLLKLFTYLNQSSGEPELLITALRSFTKATYVHYLEVFPAKVLLGFSSPFTPASSLRNTIQRLAVGGVKISLEWSNDTDADFDFDGEGIFPPHTNTEGFSEKDFIPLMGGKFVENI